MELHEVKMVNPNVFMGMDVVKRFLLFLQEQINPSTSQHNLSRRPVLTDRNPHIEVRFFHFIRL